MALAEGGKKMLLAVQRTPKASSLPDFENSPDPLIGIGAVQLSVLEVDCFSRSFGDKITSLLEEMGTQDLGIPLLICKIVMIINYM